jgi:hypothetical protein
MAYLGNSNLVQNFTPAVDYFNGNGSATTFTLSRTVGSSFDIQAFIENVPQNPSSAFTVAGNVITFTSAPPSGTNNIYVRYTSPVVQQVKPAPGTVGPTELNSAYSLWNLSGANINYTAGSVGIGTSNTFGNSLASVAQGITVFNVGATMPFFQTYVSTAGSNLKTWRHGGDASGNYLFQTVNDAYSSATEYVRITSGGFVGIGTTTPTTNLQVNGSGSGTFGVYNDPLIVKGSAFTYLHLLGTDNQAGIIYNRNGSTGWFTGLDNDGKFKFGYMSSMNQTGLTNAKDSGSPSLILDTAGKVAIGGTGNFGQLSAIQSGAGGYCIGTSAANNGGTFYHMQFTENGTQRGSITSNGGSTSYVTGSDYRLKDNIEPMTNALAKVTQLKPSTWTWKSNNNNGQGFIAHELQAVVPDAVVGEKDAVDKDGNPEYQGIDTSFLVATLTAAIQEQQAIIENLKTRIEILENK